jgi:hypothetical protein
MRAGAQATSAGKCEEGPEDAKKVSERNLEESLTKTIIFGENRVCVSAYS